GPPPSGVQGIERLFSVERIPVGSPLPPTFAAASGGNLMGGANNLQASLDSLTRSINRLMSQGSGGSATGCGVPWVSGSLSNIAGSFPRPQNPFSRLQGPAMSA